MPRTLGATSEKQTSLPKALLVKLSYLPSPTCFACSPAIFCCYPDGTLAACPFQVASCPQGCTVSAHLATLE